MNLSQLKKRLPITPGVYLMKNRVGGVLYVGKAANLKRRVLSYFERPQEARIERMLRDVAKVEIKKTDTVIEALILEARLIKKYQTLYNVLEKDDTSFLHVVIPREKFSRVLLVREKEALSFNKPLGNFGPFLSPASVREALKILRRIFPWSDHDLNAKHSTLNANSRPCFNFHIDLCPGTCANAITREDYMKNIRGLITLFKGGKQKILRGWKKEMKQLSSELRFEEAAKLRRRIEGLEHIKDIAVLKEKVSPEKSEFYRVEGYDISNISGTSAVGSMVVFTDGVPDKAQYRKFRIKTISGQNDVGMLKEVLMRRFSRHIEKDVIARVLPRQSHGKVNYKNSWPTPDLILIDGGLPQVNAARLVLREMKINIPVMGIAKGPERKRNDFLYPPELHDTVAKNRDMLIRVRDEAHRFAIKYHRELRSQIKTPRT